MVFALSSVLKAPQKNSKRKNHHRTTTSSSSNLSQSTVAIDAKKRRKVHFDTKAVVVTPPPNSSSSVPALSSTAASISSSTVVTASSSSTEVSSSFEPRRSKRISQSTVQHDNDTWIECSVVNIKKKKLGRGKGDKHKTRSLFYSVETQRGWWDEPPSGASNVVYLGQGGGLEVVRKTKKCKES
eukprot:scaffold13753_cov65-Cyclotella_meneghiniana.AAC.11